MGRRAAVTGEQQGLLLHQLHRAGEGVAHPREELPGGPGGAEAGEGAQQVRRGLAEVEGVREHRLRHLHRQRQLALRDQGGHLLPGSVESIAAVHGDDQVARAAPGLLGAAAPADRADDGALSPLARNDLEPERPRLEARRAPLALDAPHAREVQPPGAHLGAEPQELPVGQVRGRRGVAPAEGLAQGGAEPGPQRRRDRRRGEAQLRSGARDEDWPGAAADKPGGGRRQEVRIEEDCAQALQGPGPQGVRHALRPPGSRRGVVPRRAAQEPRRRLLLVHPDGDAAVAVLLPVPGPGATKTRAWPAGRLLVASAHEEEVAFSRVLQCHRLDADARLLAHKHRELGGTVTLRPGGAPDCARRPGPPSSSPARARGIERGGGGGR
mmetsp:Transcript_95406/g.294317  ORF Transcript_95406/g.294317 Transcript_95406/m.294317 type:complete len:383 (+) Transcript_95406:729-1877(+)